MLRQSSLEQLALKNNHNLLQACAPAVAVGVRCGLLCWCSADTRAAICESKNHTCLISTAAETEALFQVESTQGSGNCARSHGLACLSGYTAKTLNPWSAVGLWIISAPLRFPLSPCAIHLLSSSSPVNIRGLAELRLSSPPTPAPWRAQKQDFILYTSFSISAIARGICKMVSAVVFLMCCYASSASMFLHSYREKLSFQRIKKKLRNLFLAPLSCCI